MKIFSLGFHLWFVTASFIIGFIAFSGDSYVDVVDFESKHEPSSVLYNYDRIDEVKRSCSKFTSSTSALKSDSHDRVRSIMQDLSFVNGDWEQEDRGAPLMPFLLPNSSDRRSPLHLVYFVIKNVDVTQHSKKSVSVHGVMQLGITLESLNPRRLSRKTLLFQMRPGSSLLLISFQGIYTETEKNGGERVMCLLGNTMLPSRKPNSGDPWEWLKDFDYSNVPPLLQDDQILLLLHYPKEFSLTSRAIRGEMKSLNPRSNLKYFDTIHISSQLENSANYKFVSKAIVAKACDPYPYKDSLISSTIKYYKGSDFCRLLGRLINDGDALTILPNWRCNGTDEFCNQLGPFVTDKEIISTHGGFRDFRLLMHVIQCQQTNNGKVTKVSSIFRAVHPMENVYTEAQRSGLGNMTISSEGIWDSSSGQLCMVGCLGIVDSNANGCDSRICLYVPLSFSIKQRSIIVGSISSIHNLYFPLSFEKLLKPSELWAIFSTPFLPHYTYSKIDSAGIVLEKDEPFSFQTIVKKSSLNYPKLETGKPYLAAHSLLSEDLTFHVPGVSDPYPYHHHYTQQQQQPSMITDTQMVISSLGSLFGRMQRESFYGLSSDEYTEKQLLLNISAQLTLTGKSYTNFSVTFLEGLYDPHVGKMYLIGCRDVRASWKVLHESMDLEAGLDCSIEVIISYPPTTSRWLVNPSAMISISSQRNEDDPLYFSSLKIQTFPILYRKQREDIISRRGIEGILKILTLSAAIACICSQLFYTRDEAEAVPFISLVMLGVQCLGFSLPLLFKRLHSQYELANQWFDVVSYAVKFEVLVCFILTLWLFIKVLKSRILRSQSPLEMEKIVILATFVVHAVGYLTVLMFREPLRTEKFVDSMGNTRNVREWVTQLHEYAGVVQDLFLLPQVMGNLAWKIECNPLRKLYFAGITGVRIMPRVYDYVRTPGANPYFLEEYVFVNPRFNFYSEMGDMVIIVIAAILGVAVYAQQRWNHERIGQALRLLLHHLSLGPKMYQRLPSQSSPEAELSSRTDPIEEEDGQNEEP